MGLICTLVFALFATTGCQAEQQTTTPSQTEGTPAQVRIIDHAEFDVLESSDQEMLILDVRTPREYAQSHVPGAINIPHNALSKRLDEVSDYKDKTVVAYCESGGRTRIALDILKKNGHKDLGHLKGDMSGWRRAGRPVE